MARAMTEALIALKMSWFRVMCYFLIPFGMYLQSQTETWSGETWDETHPFLKWRMLFIACLIGINGLVAFLDKTSQRVQEEIQRRRDGYPASQSTGITQFFTADMNKQQDKPNDEK